LTTSISEDNLKTIEKLSQSPYTQYLNYCRFPLAYVYCKANKADEFDKKYSLKDDVSIMDQYLDYIRFEDDSIDDIRIKFNQ
jgi:hypothetical protein